MAVLRYLRNSFKINEHTNVDILIAEDDHASGEVTKQSYKQEYGVDHGKGQKGVVVNVGGTECGLNVLGYVGLT